MKFWTDRYEFTHGRKPRGRGRYAFKFYAEARDVHPLVVREGEPGDFACIWFAAEGTWTEAKRDATAKAHELGASFVLLCS